MRKFELTTNTKMHFGRKLFQIRALISFANVKAGDLGGYVEKEENLSHYGNAWVSGNAWVCDNARVSGNAWVSDDARVSGNAWVFGNARVSDDARVFGRAWVFGRALVCGNARVYGNADYMIVGPIGSRNAFTTFYRRRDGITMVVCGCFHGTIDEFEAQVNETHGNNQHARAYIAAIQLAKARVNTEPAEKSEEE